jgi:hypothetical protein
VDRILPWQLTNEKGLPVNHALGNALRQVTARKTRAGIEAQQNDIDLKSRKWA